MHMRTWAALLILSLALGCRIRIAEPYPPAPNPRWMAGDEAVARSHAYCAERNLSCDVETLKLDDRRWKVRLRAHGLRSGTIHLEFSAPSGRLLRAKEHLKRPKRDDDDDDDDHPERHDDDDD